MKIPKVIVLRTAGTNCDKETAFAFETAGAASELVHINELASGNKDLSSYHILAIPGGFSYGDDIASGKILANELRFKIEDSMQKFVNDEKLIIGICNGFQILVKAGLLPNISGDLKSTEATLTLNDSDKFEDRWVYLKRSAKCAWTQGLPEIITLPVAHGEGKFIPQDETILKKLREKGMIVFRYVDEHGRTAGYPHNPNGAVDNIAGICDKSGRVFGLMPHPERHISAYQHPFWTRNQDKKTDKSGDGLAIFASGVNFAKKSL